MASVKYIVRTTSTDKKKNSKIRVRMRAGRKVDLYADSLQVIESCNWDSERERVKQKIEVKNADQINKNLRDMKAFIEDQEKLTTDKTKLTKKWLTETIDKFYNPEKYEVIDETLFSFIQSFINRAGNRINHKTGNPVSYKMTREYERTFFYLKEYAKSIGKEPNFDNIDLDFYEDFVAFLKKTDSTRKVKLPDETTVRVKLSTNTIGKKIQTLKIFLNEATEKGVNTNMKYMSNKFTPISEESESFYLNEGELDEFYSYDFSDNKRLEKVRDLFIIGCWTGLRFSDLSKLSTDRIKDGFIDLKQKKTGGKVVIPIHPVVKSIFEKYNGDLPRAISNQKFNDYLREAAKEAGIDEEVHKGITRGGKRVSRKYKKHELLTTHTARRSFATNLYKAGFPSQSIMQITGHRTETAFLKYLKVTPDEHAKLLKEFWLNKKSHLKVV